MFPYQVMYLLVLLKKYSLAANNALKDKLTQALSRSLVKTSNEAFTLEHPIYNYEY